MQGQGESYRKFSRLEDSESIQTSEDRPSIQELIFGSSGSSCPSTTPPPSPSVSLASDNNSTITNHQSSPSPHSEPGSPIVSPRPIRSVNHQVPSTSLLDAVCSSLTPSCESLPSFLDISSLFSLPDYFITPPTLDTVFDFNSQSELILSLLLPSPPAKPSNNLKSVQSKVLTTTTSFFLLSEEEPQPMDLQVAKTHSAIPPSPTNPYTPRQMAAIWLSEQFSQNPFIANYSSFHIH